MAVIMCPCKKTESQLYEINALFSEMEWDDMNWRGERGDFCELR